MYGVIPFFLTFSNWSLQRIQTIIWEDSCIFANNVIISWVRDKINIERRESWSEGKICLMIVWQNQKLGGKVS